MSIAVLRAACRPGGPLPLPGKSRNELATLVRRAAGWDRAYPESVLSYQGGFLVAGRCGRDRGIALGFAGRPPQWTAGLAPKSAQGGLEGVVRREKTVTIWILEGDHATLSALRKAVSFLRPVPAGNRASFGFGDRTGWATPGHLAALEGHKLFPILAQQSIREMGRTARTPDDVMDAAVFGALQCGHTTGFGADADHLKTVEDVDRLAAAGFVLFTLDSADEIGIKAEGPVPGAAAWEKKYLGKSFSFEGKRGTFEVLFDPPTLHGAIAKFGRAVAHSAELAARVKAAARGRAHEIEIAVDETPVTTTPADHVFIARELQARGVRIASFAPKFVGEFEKGVDYKGDPREFEKELELHAAIARAQGNYKISIHSGSDKFSVYPAIARATGGYFHLKTAGTSYMEALRVVARRDPTLFRELAEFARGQFGKDRASYHISGKPETIPPPGELKDEDLERVYVVEDDGRQVLHVTYGSVLTARTKEGWRFRDRVLDLLAREEEGHARALTAHFGRHLRPLARR